MPCDCSPLLPLNILDHLSDAPRSIVELHGALGDAPLKQLRQVLGDMQRAAMIEQVGARRAPKYRILTHEHRPCDIPDATYREVLTLIGRHRTVVWLRTFCPWPELVIRAVLQAALDRGELERCCVGNLEIYTRTCEIRRLPPPKGPFPVAS